MSKFKTSIVSILFFIYIPLIVSLFSSSTFSLVSSSPNPPPPITCVYDQAKIGTCQNFTYCQQQSTQLPTPNLCPSPDLFCCMIQPAPLQYSTCQVTTSNDMNSTGLCLRSSNCPLKRGKIVSSNDCDNDDICCIMTPDSTLVNTPFTPSPNILLERHTGSYKFEMTTLMLYGSSGMNVPSLLSYYSSSLPTYYNTSIHYIISLSGDVTQLVKESDVAFHAQGLTTLKSEYYWVSDKVDPVFFTIGIMLENNSTTNANPLTQPQSASANALIMDLLQRWWSFLEINPASDWQTDIFPSQPGAAVNMSQFLSLKYLSPPIIPDYPAAQFVPSHNYAPTRFGEQVGAIILHGTMMDGGAVAWMEQNASSVSAHYVVQENGNVVQMVREMYSAWHNGVTLNTSAFWGQPNGNYWTIGIEHERNRTNSNIMPDVQIQASLDLVSNILDRYGNLEIYQHWQFHVGRICPGPNFPLEKFMALKDRFNDDSLLDMIIKYGVIGAIGLAITIIAFFIIRSIKRKCTKCDQEDEENDLNQALVNE